MGKLIGCVVKDELGVWLSVPEIIIGFEKLATMYDVCMYFDQVVFIIMSDAYGQTTFRDQQYNSGTNNTTLGPTIQLWDQQYNSGTNNTTLGPTIQLWDQQHKLMKVLRDTGPYS